MDVKWRTASYLHNKYHTHKITTISHQMSWAEKSVFSTMESNKDASCEGLNTCRQNIATAWTKCDVKASGQQIIFIVIATRPFVENPLHCVTSSVASSCFFLSFKVVDTKINVEYLGRKQSLIRRYGYKETKNHLLCIWKTRKALALTCRHKKSIQYS